MVMSVPMQRAYDVAKKHDENLKATNPLFNFCVQIIHEEGTYYWFECAFLMMWKDPKIIHDPNNVSKHQGEWLLVFTEHQGFHVFAPDDLYGYNMYTKHHTSPQVLEP